MTDYWIKGTAPHPSLDWADNQANPSVAYPFVEQTNYTPAGQKTTHRATQSEWEYMHAVNEWMGCGDSMPYVRKSGSGVINSASNQEYPFGTTVPRHPNPYPKMEGVASGHNYVRGTGQKKNGAVEILMFDTDKPFPNVEDVNPVSHPWLFDEFHSINKKGEVGLAPEGKKFYYPRACKGGKAWMPLDILEQATIPNNLYNSAEEPMTRAHGIDISKYQVTFSPASNPPRPIDFAIQRTSYAMVKDERFDQLLPGIKQVPRRGSYHYFSSGAEPIAQADFARNVEAQAGNPFHFHACDIEKAYNNVNQAFFRNAMAYMDYRVGKGDKVILYTNPNMLYEAKNYLTSNDFAKFLDYPLWVAHYWYTPNPNGQPGYPEVTGDWLFWQYEITNNPAPYGSGGSGLDLDVFNGTVEELDAWLDIDNTDPNPADCAAEIEAAVAAREQEIINFIKG